MQNRNTQPKEKPTGLTPEKSGAFKQALYYCGAGNKPANVVALRALLKKDPTLLTKPVPPSVVEHFITVDGDGTLTEELFFLCIRIVWVPETILSELIKQGASINDINPRGFSALSIAVMYRPDWAKSKIKSFNFKKPFAINQYPLHSAVRHKNKDLIVSITDEMKNQGVNIAQQINKYELKDDSLINKNELKEDMIYQKDYKQDCTLACAANMKEDTSICQQLIDACYSDNILPEADKKYFANNLKPLIMAIEDNCTHLIAFYIDTIQIDVNRKCEGKSIFEWACKCDRQDLAKKITSRLDIKDNSALCLAISKGYTDIAKQLIDAGMSIDEENSKITAFKGVPGSPLSIACYYNRIDIVKLLIEKNVQVKGTVTPLMGAMNNDNMEIIDLLLTNGADVNAICPVIEDDVVNNTILSFACRLGRNVDVVKRLIEAKADVKDPRVIISTGSGLKDNKEVIGELVEQGADVNAIYSKVSALHFASLFFNQNTAKALIENKANVNAFPEECDYAPLHFASKRITVQTTMGDDSVIYENNNNIINSKIESIAKDIQAKQASVVQVLLEAGADPNLPDNNKKITPLVYATMANNLATVSALLAHNADIYKTIADEPDSAPLQLALFASPAILKQMLEKAKNTNSIAPIDLLKKMITIVIAIKAVDIAKASAKKVPANETTDEITDVSEFDISKRYEYFELILKFLSPEQLTNIFFPDNHHESPLYDFLRHDDNEFEIFQKMLKLLLIVCSLNIIVDPQYKALIKRLARDFNISDVMKSKIEKLFPLANKEEQDTNADDIAIPPSSSNAGLIQNFTTSCATLYAASEIPMSGRKFLQQNNNSFTPSKKEVVEKKAKPVVAEVTKKPDPITWAEGLISTDDDAVVVYDEKTNKYFYCPPEIIKELNDEGVYHLFEPYFDCPKSTGEFGPGMKATKSKTPVTVDIHEKDSKTTIPCTGEVRCEVKTKHDGIKEKRLYVIAIPADHGRGELYMPIHYGKAMHTKAEAKSISETMTHKFSWTFTAPDRKTLKHRM